MLVPLADFDDKRFFFLRYFHSHFESHLQGIFQRISRLQAAISQKTTLIKIWGCVPYYLFPKKKWEKMDILFYCFAKSFPCCIIHRWVVYFVLISRKMKCKSFFYVVSFILLLWCWMAKIRGAYLNF